MSELKALLSQRLPDEFDAAAGMQRGDFDLAPPGDPVVAPASLKPAAVLVPIVMRAGAPTVLLTERSPHLPEHAGQISFPGGGVSVVDDTPQDTALREAEEEVGLSRLHVDIRGVLDIYRTGTGYAIHPVVALVSDAAELKADPREVADIFEVPFAFLMDKANHQVHRAVWKGRERAYYAMPYKGRYIWGATAGIIKNLHDRLYGAAADGVAEAS